MAMQSNSEAEHAPPSSLEVKKIRNYAQSPYVFTEQYSVKQRKILTLLYKHVHRTKTFSVKIMKVAIKTNTKERNSQGITN
jgi:hypothetical protein